MHGMAWQVQVEPVVTGKSSLPARNVRHGDNYEATRFQNARDPAERRVDVRQVLQDVPQHHHVEMLVGKLIRIERPDGNRNTQYAADMSCCHLIQFDPMRLPSVRLEVGKNQSPTASDVQD